MAPNARRYTVICEGKTPEVFSTRAGDVLAALEAWNRKATTGRRLGDVRTEAKGGDFGPTAVRGVSGVFYFQTGSTCVHLIDTAEFQSIGRRRFVVIVLHGGWSHVSARHSSEPREALSSWAHDTKWGRKWGSGLRAALRDESDLQVVARGVWLVPWKQGRTSFFAFVLRASPQTKRAPRATRRAGPRAVLNAKES
jgi:hypothetical protein